MNQLSLTAYFSRVEPTLTRREKEVLEVIEEIFPVTCEGVARHMGKFPHQISGRFTGLKKKNQIRVVDEVLNNEGNKVALYVPAETRVEWDG